MKNTLCKCGHERGEHMEPNECFDGSCACKSYSPASSVGETTFVGGHADMGPVEKNGTEWRERFDQFLLGKYENGMQVPRTKEEWYSFIEQVRTEAYEEGKRWHKTYREGQIDGFQEGVEEAVKVVRESGHEQEDTTVWCNMDELLTTLEKLQEITKK